MLLYLCTVYNAFKLFKCKKSKFTLSVVFSSMEEHCQMARSLFDSGKTHSSVIGAVRKYSIFKKQLNTLQLVFSLTAKRCNLQRCRFDSDRATSQVKSLAKWRKLSCICLLKAYNRLVPIKVHAGKYFVHLKLLVCKLLCKSN